MNRRHLLRRSALFTSLLLFLGHSLQSQDVKKDPGLPASEYLQKQSDLNLKALNLFDRYCFGCHDEELQRGKLDLSKTLYKKTFDSNLIFENLITGKMSLKKKKQPTAAEKEIMLRWLTAKQKESFTQEFRRLSRHEFVYSINDLLNTNIDLRDELPEDRGTYKYDTNHKIKLTDIHLKNYFSVTDKMLKYA